MTKIKNTKKGMAKKTLSMSLVVAMLATSNVPVWAAEFSDGSDVAVTSEAPAAEAFSDNDAEAPVVEDTTEVVDTATATAPTLKLTNWNSHLEVEGDLKDGDADLKDFYYEVRIDGREVVGHTGTWKSTTTVANKTELNNALNSLNFKAEDAGHTVSLVLTKNDFNQTIPGIAIDNVKVDTVAELDVNAATAPTYTGKQAAYADSEIKKFVIKDKGAATVYSSLKWDDFTYTYTGEDLVNATPTSKTLHVVATVNKAGYEGQLTADFRIGKRRLNANDLEITLKKNTVSFAELSGNVVPSDAVEVKDTVTGEILPPATYTTIAQSGLANVGAESVLLARFDSTSLAKDKKTKSNYTGNADKVTTDKAKLVANKIDDFNIVVDGIGKDKVADLSTIKNAIHFYLGEKDVTSAALTNKITFSPESYTTGATSLSVVLTGNNKEITGTKTVTLPVTTNVISAADLTFEIGKSKYAQTATTPGVNAFGKSENLGAETYTGEAVTKDIKNVKSKTTNLVADRDYKIVYTNDNVNAKAVSEKTVTVSIVGMGDWSGTIVLGTFDITPAVIKRADITVPEKVQYDGSLQTANDYLAGKVTVKAETTVNGSTKKIDVPADAYKLTCTADKLAVGGVITTKIAKDDISNKNFTIDITGGATEVTAAKTTKITNKDIADTNVKVEVEGSYTYTGKEIVPAVKVSVDGVELAKDIDYKIKSCTNNVNAGEATVTVEGDGDYSGTQTVKFTINKANLSDVKVEAKTKTDAEKAAFTYTGKQVKPTTGNFKITLNGVELKASDFAITYPTTSKVNVNVGDATVALAPVKDNKNFIGDKKDVAFKILPRALSTSNLNGSFYAFDENGDKIDFTKTNYVFGYDGTEKTFKDIKFVPSVAKYNSMNLVEGKDYEIKYFNNITGPTAAVYVVGIGNYTGSTKFDGSDTTYTVKQDFKIEGVTVKRKNITVSDTEYAGGIAVTPNLTIKVGDKTLVEGTDYEFTGLSNNANVTDTNKVLKATLKLKNGYTLIADKNEWTGVFSNPVATPSTKTYTVDVKWKIVKKDLANTTVEVSETNGKLTATVLNGNVVVPAKEYDVKDNGDGTATVTAKADSKSYKGSQKVSVKKSENVGAPVISNVNVSGNTATVILSGETDGASGYDYVISTSKDPANKDARLDVVKNQVQTTANFKYVPQGTYYAYCHAWTRDENGKKVFGGWSNSYAFSVTAITPDTPEILSVKTKGSTITVTYKESANSTGYDVVLGKGSKKEHGETRPYQYGKYKKLNVKPGVCKAVFKNIPAGTYYAGVHSWNRTASENDNKVFSKWSNLETAKVK